jgi:hypothetical protein
MKILTLFLLSSLAMLTFAKPLAHSHHNPYQRRTPRHQTPAHERRGIAFNDPAVLPYFLGGQGNNVHITWKYNWDSKTDESRA